MASVGIQEVKKRFGATEVLQGISVDIADEEFVVLVGPSGCGKSTLLRMIAGLEEITSGAISIGGRVVNNLPPKSRDIAMVFQNYALYPHMTVFENMAFSMRLRKAPQAEVETRVNTAADILGLRPYLDRYPRQLSGGQRQRVAMGRAIVRDPQVFLFDEPLSNLDAKLRASAREELEQFHKNVQTTTIYVTHDQVEAMAMGDRVVVLHQGFVRQIGTPKEVYEEPADTFVATFLGAPPMNLLEFADVIVGFRPESFLPAQIITGAKPVRFRYMVNYVEYLGAERLLYGRIQGSGFESREIISRLSWTMTTGYDEGSVHDFAVAESDLRFFDRKTEKRDHPRPYPWQ
jgi:multiple sugar transport system ATP-binding protein